MTSSQDHGQSTTVSFDPSGLYTIEFSYTYTSSSVKESINMQIKQTEGNVGWFDVFSTSFNVFQNVGSITIDSPLSALTSESFEVSSLPSDYCNDPIIDTTVKVVVYTYDGLGDDHETIDSSIYVSTATLSYVSDLGTYVGQMSISDEGVYTLSSCVVNDDNPSPSRADTARIDIATAIVSFSGVDYYISSDQSSFVNTLPTISGHSFDFEFQLYDIYSHIIPCSYDIYGNTLPIVSWEGVETTIMCTNNEEGHIDGNGYDAFFVSGFAAPCVPTFGDIVTDLGANTTIHVSVMVNDINIDILTSNQTMTQQVLTSSSYYNTTINDSTDVDEIHSDETIIVSVHLFDYCNYIVRDYDGVSIVLENSDYYQMVGVDSESTAIVMEDRGSFDLYVDFYGSSIGDVYHISVLLSYASIRIIWTAVASIVVATVLVCLCRCCIKRRRLRLDSLPPVNHSPGDLLTEGGQKETHISTDAMSSLTHPLMPSYGQSSPVAIEEPPADNVVEFVPTNLDYQYNAMQGQAYMYQRMDDPFEDTFDVRL
eukprot:gnl/Dysnectes_brevis/7057_a11487_274.p1 GENE.gnl/Dysnectes_brevis/7057_a11487_274~~gnl/Dysnectes_brevis/7057_a11487_274.p1  ORF type:complete len:623 (-),score=9.19 gnl/Dysnectes_brevis/7057_a11487_274:95-1711(-)